MCTRLLQQAPIPMRLFIGILNRFAQTPERVAASLVQLAVAPEFVDTAGQLIQNGKALASPFIGDTAAQERLWTARPAG